MVAPSPFALPSAVNNISSFMQWANGATNSMLGVAFLIGIFFVSFAALSLYSKEKVFVVSLFLTFLASVLFAALGLVGGMVIVICAIGFLASALFLHSSSSV